MRTTITLDDDLLAQAQAMTGVTERSKLIHDGLRLLIQREAARRLAQMGGSDRTAMAAPRRRSVAVAQVTSTTSAKRSPRARKKP